MSWSFGEIRSLTIKAAHGAGMEWGLAEEAGFAVVSLERQGLAGVSAFAEYLQETKQKGYLPTSCPIFLGVSYSDTGGEVSLPDLSDNSALLLLPFIKTMRESENIRRVPEDRRESIKVLEAFAAQTYAPDTEESRARGAGAGNDGNE